MIHLLPICTCWTARMRADAADPRVDSHSEPEVVMGSRYHSDRWESSENTELPVTLPDEPFNATWPSNLLLAGAAADIAFHQVYARTRQRF